MTAVQTGVADIVTIIPGYFLDQLPLDLLWNLPTAYGKNGQKNLACYYDLYDEFLAPYRDELDVHQLTDFMCMGYDSVNTRREIAKYEDFDGLTAVGPTKHISMLCQRLDMLPIRSGYWEWYEHMQKGTTDLLFTQLSSMYAGFYWTVAKPVYISIHEGAVNSNGPDFIRNELWDEFPADIQEIMEDSFHIFHGLGGYTQRWESMCDTALEIFEEKGPDEVVVTYFTEEENRRLVEDVYLPHWQDWAEDVDSLGHRGTDLINAVAQWYEENEDWEPQPWVLPSPPPTKEYLMAKVEG
jgi:TRAP-type C4-dicarboxylate transport system substrate-binding protein